MPTYRACLKEIIPWMISLTAFAKSLRDDPADSHDRRSLEDVAALKTAREDCDGAFGVRVQGASPAFTAPESQLSLFHHHHVALTQKRPIDIISKHPEIVLSSPWHSEGHAAAGSRTYRPLFDMEPIRTVHFVHAQNTRSA
jgi:hypothetical protein